jgi:hypothetical protein
MLSHYCAEGAVSFATCANNISVSTRVAQQAGAPDYDDLFGRAQIVVSSAL